MTGNPDSDPKMFQRRFEGPCVLNFASVDTLFPMHAMLDGQGRIFSLGRTLWRVLDQDITGTNFFEAFAVKKPRSLKTIADLHAHSGRRFSVQAKGPVAQELRCTAVLLGPDGEDLLIDMAFASDLVDALKTHGLSASDFRANDASLDLVFLLETQAALLADAQRMTSALQEAKRQAERRADEDPVTGMPNRRSLESRLAAAMVASDQPLALLHVDLDKFKAINDIYGHAAGDYVLGGVAARLQSFAGHYTNGLAARIGGDEFAVLLPVKAGIDPILNAAEDLITDLCEPQRFEGQSLAIGASIGVIQFDPDPSVSASKLLSQSDIALYRAKEAGNTVTLLTPAMLNAHRSRQTLVEEIEAGLAEDQFRPHFQPQIDTSTGDIVGLEVVARWYHPERGILLPGVFIEAAVRANLMEPIDRLVRRQAFADYAGWLADGLQARRLSLNMTAANLRSPEFLEEMLDELMGVALSPSSIRLEMLESILFDATDDVIATQSERLRAAGFSFALDDFGTGHASLATLLAAPISTLKVDRSFVAGIDTNPTLQRITGSIIAMADQLGLAVMCEGVEAKAEVELLQRFGCHLFQGFYFGKPLSAEATRGWLEDWTRLAPDDRIGFGFG